jgi:O-antigen ligase
VRPPSAYYTLVNPRFPGSYVRNQFLFERPISFGFWLVAFFPFFALGFLRKKNIKNQIWYVIIFGLLVFSTWSRAGIAVFAVEVVAVVLLLHRKALKKWLRGILALGVLSLGGIAYLGTSFFAREHSNTGHLVLVQEGRNLAKERLLVGRGAGYSGPASHQLCYNPKGNARCEAIQAINEKHSIGTYGYNPENQYLQILMEYGIVGLLFWLAMLCWILYYTAKLVWMYRNTEKSSYQKLLWWSLIGFEIGLLGLCAEGMVLHSLVDRMIVYPFFLLYGLAIGSWESIKDDVYLPVVAEKKSKKKKAGARSKGKKADKKKRRKK